MDISKLNTSHLLGLLKLTEKRDALIEELKKIESAIAGAFGISTPAAAPGKRGRKKGTKAKSKAKTKTRVKASDPAATESSAAPSSPAPAAPKRKGKGKTKARAASGKSGGKRGALKDKIITTLREAGAKGVSVKELSKSLGVKNQNLHVWFSSTGKSLGTIQKVGTGRYRLKAGA